MGVKNTDTSNTRDIYDLSRKKKLDAILDALEKEDSTGAAYASLIGGMLAVLTVDSRRNFENLTFETGQATVAATDDWPFNNPEVSINLKKTRNLLDYVVIPFAEGMNCGKSLKVKDRLVNGFKIEVENCPKTNVVVKYFVIGGML